MTALGSRGTSQVGQPTWWASLVVRTAALPLPSEHRWCYRQEFLAELYGMTPAEQRHHASGVLSRVVALRVALSEPARLLSKEATMTTPWRCRLRLHRWQRLRNPEGGWYRECRHCGAQRSGAGGVGPGGPLPPAGM
jgi:hypothetical protein